MSATTWFVIAIVGFSLSGIALAAAVFMFIKMNIPAVIGDLTGKTVAREIKAMREANASSGNKIHKSSSVNVNRGKLTEKVRDEKADSAVKAAAHASKRLDKTGSGDSASLRKNGNRQSFATPSKERTTESLSTNVGEVDIEKRRSTAILSKDRVTDVLDGTGKTGVLSNTLQTAVLSQNLQTEVLDCGSAATESRTGTTVLNGTEELTEENVTSVDFIVTRSVIMIHTDEVIG